MSLSTNVSPNPIPLNDYKNESHKPLIMKKITLVLFLVLLNVTLLLAQVPTDFNSGLMSLSKTATSNIKDTNIVKIAVWDFTDLNGSITTLGKYISEEVSINLVNVGKSFQVMNRNHLAQILKEHNLNSNGFIDQNTTKELGKLQAVDAIITGTVTVLNEKIKVTMQVLNTETALTIAASMVEIAMNDDIKILLGLSSYDNSGSIVNSSTIKPGENEVYNDDKLVNPKCESTHTGDICFYNATNEYVLVVLYQGTLGGQPSKEIAPGETKCFYDQSAARKVFKIYSSSTKKPQLSQYEQDSNLYKEGAILIEKCKSKTYTIK